MPDVTKRANMMEGNVPWNTDVPVDRRLSFNQGQSVRLMVLQPKVSVTFSHYIDTDFRATIVRCDQLDGKVCALCQEGDIPKARFGANVLVYWETNPLVWDIKPWFFGTDKWDELHRLFEKMEPHSHDLNVYCYNETFQRVNIKLADGAPVWDRIPGLKEKVIEAYKKEATKVLQTIQGMSVTEYLELREKQEKKKKRDKYRKHGPSETRRETPPPLEEPLVSEAKPAAEAPAVATTPPATETVPPVSEAPVPATEVPPVASEAPAPATETVSPASEAAVPAAEAPVAAEAPAETPPTPETPPASDGLELEGAPEVEAATTQGPDTTDLDRMLNEIEQGDSRD